MPDAKRTARFVCAVAAAFPGGEVVTARGTIEGIIGYEERGENGFGYDPIFYNAGIWLFHGGASSGRKK